MNKKELHLILWKDCKNPYVQKEYVYETIPSFVTLDKLIKNKKIIICFGKNPSKATGIVCDETNMYLKNKLYEDNVCNGYFLINYYSEFGEDFPILKEKMNEDYLKRILLFLEHYKNEDIILFYGADMVSKNNEFFFDDKLLVIFEGINKNIQNRKNKKYTANENKEFKHPRTLKGNMILEPISDSVQWEIKGKKKQ